ncbi:MAG: DUF5691 domain-containing protein [Phototrophicaceae bacterium]
MTNDHLWQPLVTAALVGTQTRPLGQLPSDNTAVGKALARVTAATPEAALLKGAVILNSTQAAQTPILPYKSKFSATAPTDSVPEAPAKAAELLVHILKKVKAPMNGTLLREWIYAAEGYRVPDHLLALYLDQLAKLADNSNFNRLYAASLVRAGERGRWLAAQRDKWTFVLWEQSFERGWAKSTAAVRLLLFRRLRQQDAAAARAFFEQKQASLPPKVRLDYLSQLLLNLSGEDEALLEGLLDDPILAMRVDAANMLMKLPESAFVGRMIERMRGRVSIQPDGDGKLKLGCAHYDVADAAMLRDWVKRNQYRLTDGAAMSRIMMGCIPPRLWNEWLGEDTPTLIALAAHEEALYLEAWMTAAINFGDAEWCNAFFDWAVANDKSNIALRVLPTQPANVRETYTLNLWGKDTRNLQLYPSLYTDAHGHWTEAFSQSTLLTYAQKITSASSTNMNWLIVGFSSHWAFFHPSQVRAFIALFEQYIANHPAGNHYVKQITPPLEYLRLRQQIHEAFGHTGAPP